MHEVQDTVVIPAMKGCANHVDEDSLPYSSKINLEGGTAFDYIRLVFQRGED